MVIGIIMVQDKKVTITPSNKRSFDEEGDKNEQCDDLNAVNKKKKESQETVSIVKEEGEDVPHVLFSSITFTRKMVKGKLDPLVLLDSHAASIDAALALYNVMQPALPPWWPNAAGVDFPLTSDRLKFAILSYLSTFTNGGVHGNSCIAPNSLTEYGRMTGVLTALNSDPFIAGMRTVDLGNGPLFTVYHVRDSMKSASCFASVIPAIGTALPIFV